MLEDIEIEKIIQDIDSGLTDYTIGKKYKHSHNTIANIRKEHEDADAGENQEEAKKQEVHFDNPIDKVRAIPKAIDDLIKTEQLKADDRAEWEKRKEEIKGILKIEVDDTIAEEREDAIEKRDEQWREHIKENHVKKEVVTNLRSILGEKDTTIEDLTKTIEEKDDLITNLNNKNIGLNNDNTALRETNADLSDYIGNYLDDAGRREKIACVRGQNRLEQERSSLDRYIRKMSNWRLELVQRDKDLSEVQKLLDDQADKQQIERKEIIQEQDRVQKLLDDQVVKQQKKATELEQKKYELEQKEYELKQNGDAIAAEKKALMKLSREIGKNLAEIDRNKHLLFLTGEREKVLERTIRANFP